MWDGTLDGVEFYTAASLPNPTLFTNNTLLVFLFARNNNGTDGNFAPAKIYAFRVRKAGVLVNNLVPCKTASAVGFYDTVTKTFLAGSGTLTAGADVTPSPSTPVDIVTNNGALRVRRQSGLPLVYQRVEYIEGDGNQYIDTGFYFDDLSTDTFVIDFMRTASSKGTMLYGTRVAYKKNGYCMQFQNTGATYIQWGDKDMGLGNTNAGQLNVRYSTTRRGSYYEFNGASYNVTDAVTPTQSYPLYFFCVNNSGTAGQASAMRIYGATDTNAQGVVKMNLVPAKRLSDNALGLYDLVRGVFLTNQGTGSFTAGEVVDDPVEIYTDGTDEVLTVRGKNLFDPTKVLFGYYREFSTGNKRESSANFISSDDGYIPCLPNTAYTFVGTNKTDGTYSKYNTIYFFDSAKNYLGASPYEISQPTTGTTPSNCYYLQIRSNPLDTASVTIQEAFSRFNWQLEQSSTPTDYEPYVTPQTVSVPTLLGVGDYKDETELIQGIKTGKIGVKVFDGTENWIAYTSSTLVVQNATSDWGAVAGVGGYCTHLTVLKAGETTFAGACRFATAFNVYEYKTAFGVADVAGFKAYLAAQYAAGTPVIVIYPLTTETTEQGTAYPQLVNAKYNTASVTAEVSDIQVTFTTGAQTVPTPYSPLPIVCNNGELKWNGTAVVADGTPEVLTVTGQNLVDLAAVTDGYYYDPSGVYTSIAVARLTDYISVKAGQTYTIYVKAQRVGTAANVRCNLFDSAKEWKSQSSFVVNSGDDAVSTITPIENGFLRVSANYSGTGAKVDWSALQIVYGEYTLQTMPPYQPYTAQTASVEDLLAVGDYKDIEEIIGGHVVHKVGIKVFDGTETFTASSSGSVITTIPDVAIGAQNSPMNTHFALETSPTSIAVGAQRFGANGTKIYSQNYYMKHPTIKTVAAFKAWLSAQYAAGTPVIVIYPLADEVMESVGGQPLTTSEGTNTVSVTSNVDPVELDVEFAQSKS